MQREEGEGPSLLHRKPDGNMIASHGQVFVHHTVSWFGPLRRGPEMRALRYEADLRGRRPRRPGVSDEMSPEPDSWGNSR